MSWTLCTSGAAIAKAGAYANSTIVASSATLAEWSDEAEGTFSMKTRKDWVTNWATEQDLIKKSISDAIASDIANKIINYSLADYSQISEAQTMLNVNKDTYDTILKDLREDTNQKLNK